MLSPSNRSSSLLEKNSSLNASTISMTFGAVLGTIKTCGKLLVQSIKLRIFVYFELTNIDKLASFFRFSSLAEHM